LRQSVAGLIGGAWAAAKRQKRAFWRELSCVVIRAERWTSMAQDGARDAAKSARRVASSGPVAKRPRARAEKQRSTDQPKQTKAPARSEVMRLANEVDRLAAQLEQSQARLVDLEGKVDIDPPTELFEPPQF
jgi:hypothetical protein